MGSKKKPNPSRTHTKACGCGPCVRKQRRDRQFEKVTFGRRATATAGRAIPPHEHSLPGKCLYCGEVVKKRKARGAIVDPPKRDIQRHRAAAKPTPSKRFTLIRGTDITGSVLGRLIDAAGGADALVQPAPERGTYTTVGKSLVRIVPRRGKEKVFDVETKSMKDFGTERVRVELMLNTDGEYVFEVSLNGKVLGVAPLGEHVELQVVMK